MIHDENVTDTGEVVFDDIASGVKQMEVIGNQISLFDNIDDIQLPPLSPNVAIVRKRTGRSKNIKQLAEASMGNATICSVPKTIDLSSVRIASETDEYKQKPLKKLNITGAKNTGDTSSVISAVSNKTKQDMDERNSELLKIRRHPYIRKTCVLTDAEKVCFKFLRQRLGDKVTILSKVRLADVVELNELVTRDTAAFRKIAYKHLDYLVLSPDLDLICAVELDDYTHETDKAKERDKFVAEVLQDCGVPFFRIKSRVANLSSEDTFNIEMCVLEYMAPRCPLCGRPMEPKVSHQKSNYGHRFYGCLGWYETGANKCNYTIDIN